MGGDDVATFAASTADKVIQINPKTWFPRFNVERSMHEKRSPLRLREVAHGHEVSWKWEAPF
jgi:hypothetical protein